MKSIFLESYGLVAPSACHSFDFSIYQKAYKKIKSKLRRYKLHDSLGHNANFLFAFCYIKSMRIVTDSLSIYNKINNLQNDIQDQILTVDLTKMHFEHELEHIFRFIDWLGNNLDLFGSMINEKNFTIEFITYNLEVDCIFVLNANNTNNKLTKSFSSMLMMYSLISESNIESSLELPTLTKTNELSALRHIFSNDQLSVFEDNGYLKLPDISKYESSRLENKNIGDILLTKYFILTILNQIEKLLSPPNFTQITDSLLDICLEIREYAESILNSKTDATFTFYGLDIKDLYCSILGDTNNRKTTNERLNRLFPSIKLMVQNILDENGFHDYKLTFSRYKRLLAETYKKHYNTELDKNESFKELYSRDINNFEDIFKNLDRFWLGKKNIYILDCLILERITGFDIKDKDYLNTLIGSNGKFSEKQEYEISSRLNSLCIKSILAAYEISKSIKLNQ